MNRFYASVLLSLAACATASPPPAAPPPPSPAELRLKYCGDAAHPVSTAADEIVCGDYLSESEHDLPGAFARWRHAYQLATDRSEQCRAIIRIIKRSATPEKDWGDVSPAVAQDCQQRRLERRLEAQALARDHAECVDGCLKRWVCGAVDPLGCWELHDCESMCPGSSDAVGEIDGVPDKAPVVACHANGDCPSGQACMKTSLLGSGTCGTP